MIITLVVYAESCNEWRGLSSRLSAWATQFRKGCSSDDTVSDLTGPGIEVMTTRADSDVVNHQAN